MTDQTPLYEGMFLFSLNELGGRLGPAIDQLRQLLERVGARIEAVYKWDERKLAYEIKGNKRGLYLMSYFRVDGDQIARIERTVNLSDTILRCLILRVDHIGEIELEEARKREAETADAAQLAEEPVSEDTEDEVKTPAEPEAEAKADAETPDDNDSESNDEPTPQTPTESKPSELA